MKHFKVAIIGGGPGGYVTALRLKQYKIDTVVFEKERLGGVCLNWGCIPTKTLVKTAELFTEIKEAKEFESILKILILILPKFIREKMKLWRN